MYQRGLLDVTLRVDNGDGVIARTAEGYSVLGFVVIVILYVVIGLMSVAGTICITRRLFAPKAEQIFYGLFLILIAGFYLAFTGVFWNCDAVVAGIGSRIGVCRTRPAGHTPAVRDHHWIPVTWTVGCVA